MSERKPERWEVEADAAYSRGVDAGLRAWHEQWSSDVVHRVMARNERLKDEVRLARRAAKSVPHTEPTP